MNEINAGCADPSGTNPAPPLVLGTCTHVSALDSSLLPLLGSIISAQLAWTRERSGLSEGETENRDLLCMDDLEPLKSQ